jgi:light-regulated signal transduction histidine kinase (bacteriophytochrome)
VQRVLDEDLRAARTNRQVEIKVDALPPCQADPVLLRQVYVNLLSNALKFTSKCDHAIIEVGAKRENGSVVYFVKDNGAGFDDKYMSKLFGVFQRLHRPEDYEGTGVGLAIVQRVVVRHGGRVWAEGAVNQGAAFYFTLGDARD